MAGNVSEWVQDVYRPLTSIDLRDNENHDLNPFRGNEFDELILDEEGKPIEKDSLGYLRRQLVADDTLGLRDNYRKGDVRDFVDGDIEEFVNYGYGEWSLINDKARVYKGGSWADRLYWLSPGTRRYMDEDKTSNKIGFRCAMVRVGGETGNEDMGGIQFQEKGRKVKRRYK
jgi:formylglycine-generating enzyme required for sulfatase activity